jgi:L-ascorbate 6-phosphate lactonase
MAAGCAATHAIFDKGVYQMMPLAQRVLSCRVPEGGLCVFFAGQAGFILKDADGRLTAIDLYLSDCCERYFGFRRLMPKILMPDDLTFDTVIATHAHYDHFDPDAMPFLLADARTCFVGALDTRAECERLGLMRGRADFLKPGDEVTSGDMTVRAMPCDHGALAKDAIALLIRVAGRRIYLAGDTCWRPDHFSDPAIAGVDLFIAPINGAFGNLNELEAARAAALVKPSVAVPCHYWNFAEHGGDPHRYMEAMKAEAPGVSAELMPMGGCLAL